METTSYLVIKDDYIEFVGFKKIKNIATVCIRESGITIMTSLPQERLFLHHVINVDSDRRTYDKELGKLLLKKGIDKDSVFFLHKDVYYQSNLA